MPLELINPYDQQPIARIAYDEPHQIETKLADAVVAQQRWRDVSLSQRIEQLQLGLSKLREMSEGIITDVTRQMGKPLGQTRGEMDTLFSRANQSIADAPSALSPDILPAIENFERRIEHEPLGVVLNIAAWNYPLVIPINVIAPALLAGNSIIFKHSARTALTGQAFEEAFSAMEIPHLVTNVTLSHDATAKLIADPRVAYVGFTGSVDGGHSVYQQASQRFVSVGLELGGNDPAYVAADADPITAAENLVDGACYNAGQSCCAIERVYVHDTLYDAFVEKALTQMEAYQLGNPLEEGTTMGPLASRSALGTLETHVNDAKKRGAGILTGGQRTPDTAGNFFPPTLLTEVPQDSMVMQEESFGPLLPVKRVADDEEAIRMMNDSCFGLTASVWTNDPERAERFGRQVLAGTIFQNRCDFLDPQLPWTGWGDSGLGSTLSRFGFYHLTRRKSIHFRKQL